MTNVHVHRLPPNTTAYLQPLDAGIISAFKRRYRQRQLNYALDFYEQEGKNKMYEVNQLLAMQWSRICWKEIPATVIENCFGHTGVVIKEEVLDEEIREALEKLKISVPIAAVIHPEGEDEVHPAMTDEDIVESVLVSIEDEEECKEEDGKNERDEMDFQKSMMELKSVLQMAYHFECGTSTIKDLRRLHSQIESLMIEERNKRLQQIRVSDIYIFLIKE